MDIPGLEKVEGFRALKKLQEDGILDLEALEGQMLEEEDLEMIPSALNEVLYDLEAMLEASDADYEGVKKFGIEPIKELYSEKHVIDATTIMLKRFDEGRQELLKQLREETGVSQEDFEAARQEIG